MTIVINSLYVFASAFADSLFHPSFSLYPSICLFVSLSYCPFVSLFMLVFFVRLPVCLFTCTSSLYLSVSDSFFGSPEFACCVPWCIDDYFVLEFPALCHA